MEVELIIPQDGYYRFYCKKDRFDARNGRGGELILDVKISEEQLTVG